MMKLEELRRERGWSKAELARRAEIGEADVGKVESGRLRPYETQLRKLSAALRVPVSKMHGLLDEVPREKPGATRRIRPARKSNRRTT